MPTFPVPKVPAIADPKEASVFDPLWKTLTRKAIGLSGLTDPQSGPMQSMTPTPLVAGVPPEEIGALREAGKRLLDRIMKDGLEQRSMGQRVLTKEGYKRIFPPITPPERPIRTEADYKPNIPLPNDLKQALQFAQRRYPRIFGHIKDISDVDSFQQIATLGRTRGTQAPVSNYLKGDFVPTKFSHLGLNVSSKDPEVLADPSVVGHEILHATDNIVNPAKLKQGYKASMELPDGYKGSAYEARANVQGQRFVNSLKGIPNPKPRSLNAIESEMLASPPPAAPSATQTPTSPEDPIEWLMGKLGFGGQ